MAQKKKVVIKQGKPQSGASSITQNNNVKVYSFNPFEPKTQIIQTKTGVIRITPKVPSYLGIFEGKASNYTQLPTREIRFYSHHFVRDVNI